MNRRSFLAALAGAFVADPERLLWVPGKKMISIPKPQSWDRFENWGEIIISETWTQYGLVARNIMSPHGLLLQEFRFSCPTTSPLAPPSPAPYPQR